MSEFIRAIGIYYKNDLNAIKKSLQPTTLEIRCSH